MTTKRLFLVAAYDAFGQIDASLIYYVRELSKLGDVILCMDSDCDEESVKKLSPNVVHAMAARHGEYDFGSYKRAYMYARAARMLPAYDIVYMLNDSVYGPLMDLRPTIEKMESQNWDAFGIVCNPHREHAHIQSWFIGCRTSVFTTHWFDRFMCGITKLPSKGQITRQYEQGFTKLVADHGLSWGCLYNIPGRGVYNRVKFLFKLGMPFMKKVAFSRRHGALGWQISYVLDRVTPEIKNAILENARRTWGDEYIHWLLTKNPFKILYRNIRHSINKVFVEGI